jgi:hypothetical protein
MSDLKKLLPGLTVLLMLASAFWGPAIFGGKTLIHGDSLGHSLPLLDTQARAIKDLGQLLWSDKIYGGHALFAEGQGGFANPVNMIFAWVVAPLTGSIYAENLFHWFCMIWTGVGILLLCRSLGLEAWSSCLGAIAGVFSLDTIAQAQNLTVSGALVWVPWALWAMERWLDDATVGRAMTLAAMIALELYSGYPELLDGILLYMTIMVLVRFSDYGIRREWFIEWRPRLATFAFAVVSTVGLCAIQVLPELELIGQSHRSSGIVIGFQAPILSYLRGFLFTREIAGNVNYFPLIGSILICMLATSTLVLPTARPVKAHILGTALLIVLGMGRVTWLFRFIYDHGLLPQLHFYRVLLPYINAACLTAGVLAAAGADALARWAMAWGSTRGLLRNAARARAVLLVLFVAFWAWIVWRLYLPGNPPVQWAVAAAAIVATATAVPLRAAYFLPLILALLLIGETVALRVTSFYFGDRSLLDKPASIAAIQALPDWTEFKIFSKSISTGFALQPPSSPDLLRQMKRMFPSAGGMSNLLWDLHSMDGALALALGRRAAISQMLDDEAYGRTTAQSGARLMDMLGIRWVVFDTHPEGDAYRTLWHEEEPDSVWIMENPTARPRFQLFGGCRAVSSLDEDVAAVGSLQAPSLIVEKMGALDPCGPATTSANTEGSTFRVLKAKSTRYHLKLSAATPAWLFLADANYPGWTARLDGAEVPVYSAQVLGKAVAIPAGEHDLWIRFRSRSFEWGASITLATIAWMGMVGVLAKRFKGRA